MRGGIKRKAVLLLGFVLLVLCLIACGHTVPSSLAVETSREAKTLPSAIATSPTPTIAPMPVKTPDIEAIVETKTRESQAERPGSGLPTRGIGALDLRDPTQTPSTDNRLFIYFRRTGGFVGLDDQLTINVSGSVTLERKDDQFRFVLAIDSIRKLASLLDNAKFAELRGYDRRSRRGADFFEYQLTYQDHTVRASDPTVPNALWPVLEALDEIISIHSVR